MIHKSVLLHESIDALNLSDGAIVVDATINGGGHSEEIVKRFGSNVHIVGLDMDGEALKRAAERLKEGQVDLVKSNFRHIDKSLDGLDIGKINAALFDLGTSSNQIEESGRGFTFKVDEPLLMTLNDKPEAGEITAHEVVNEWAEESIADIIYGFGEEKFSRRIAKAIIEAREKKPITTSTELAEIIKKATPLWYHFKRIHPATRTFQAIRIAVNDELGSITEGLQRCFERLDSRGRMAVISFHSLEDRIVKHYFKKIVEEGRALAISKKPIIPTDLEQLENPRSRSAKLRIIEKI